MGHFSEADIARQEKADVARIDARMMDERTVIIRVTRNGKELLLFGIRKGTDFGRVRETIKELLQEKNVDLADEIRSGKWLVE